MGLWDMVRGIIVCMGACVHVCKHARFPPHACMQVHDWMTAARLGDVPLMAQQLTCSPLLLKAQVTPVTSKDWLPGIYSPDWLSA